MYGAVVGSGVLFAACLWFFLREGTELSQKLTECDIAQIACVAEPQPFLRFVIYGAVAMVQAMGLFVLDDRAERRRKASEFASEWQRRA
jgi:hypothetical protein